MAEEAKDDLKKGEDTNPSGTDQPEKDETGSDAGAKKETAEETVTIPKSALEKLQKGVADGENYKKGFLSIKRQGRTLPGAESDSKPKGVADEGDFGGGGSDDDDDRTGEFVTKKELKVKEHKSAIAEACKDPETDEHWDDIMTYYRPEHGQDDKEGILSDIQKAKKLWKLDNPEEPEDKGKKDTADLAADKGLSTGKEKETSPTPEKKHIIPQKEGMEKWY
ncbi:MAG: hypothetical protein PHQ35_11290 [Phycisphaerae bacterium]|nr:hypothetical protein [Phycisphaerae bacterium]